MYVAEGDHASNVATIARKKPTMTRSSSSSTTLRPDERLGELSGRLQIRSHSACSLRPSSSCEKE